MKHVLRIKNTYVPKNRALKEAGEFIAKMNYLLLKNDTDADDFIKYLRAEIKRINEAYPRCGNIDVQEWDVETWGYDSVNTTAYNLGTVAEFELLHINEVKWKHNINN